MTRVDKALCAEGDSDAEPIEKKNAKGLGGWRDPPWGPGDTGEKKTDHNCLGIFKREFSSPWGLFLLIFRCSPGGDDDGFFQQDAGLLVSRPRSVPLQRSGLGLSTSMVSMPLPTICHTRTFVLEPPQGVF